MNARSYSRREFLRGVGLAGAATLLAACKPSAPAAKETAAPVATEAAPTTVPPTAVPATAAPAKKVSLSLWGWWDTRMAIYDAVAKDFTQQNPNIEIKVETIPGADLNQKLTSSIAAGTNPTLLKMGTNYFKLRDEGLLVEFPEDIFPEAWLKDMYPGFNWETYGRYVTPTGAMPTLLIYNKKMFTEASLDPAAPPQTWADLITMAKELTKTGANGAISVCGFCPTSDDYPGLEFIYQVGSIIKKEGEKQVSGWKSAEVRQVYQLFSDMVLKDKVWDPGFPSQTESIGTRKAAMTFDESWIIGEFKTTYADVYPELGFAPPPTPSGRPEPYYGYKRYVLDLSVLKGRTDEYPAAFEFLQFMQRERPESILKLCDISTLVPDRKDLANDPAVVGSEFTKLGTQLLPKECDQVMPPDELWQIVADVVNRIAVQKEAVDSSLEKADAEWQKVLDQGLAKYFVG